MPQAIGAVVGIGGSLLGAKKQASAASDAARSQSKSASQDLALQRETRDLIRNDLAPYRQGGNDAYAAYMYEMGLGPRPTFGGTTPQIEAFSNGQWGAYGGPQMGGPQMGTQGPGDGGAPAAGQSASGQNWSWLGGLGGLGAGAGGGLPPQFGGTPPVGSAPPQSAQPGAAAPSQFRVGGQTFSTLQEAQAYANANRTGGQEYGGFKKSQDYLFGLREGTGAIEASAAARGGLFSGATMRDLNTYAQDYGSQRREGYLNRLAGVGDTGMNAAQMSGNASMAAAGNMSNALAAQGNAAAAGAIGRGNAWSDGIQNALGAWNYMRPGGSTGGAPGNPFY